MNKTLKCTICNQKVKPLNFYIKKCELCKGYVCYKCQIERDNQSFCPRCQSQLAECNQDELEEEIMKALKEEKSNRSSFDFATFSACIPSMRMFVDLEDKLKNKQLDLDSEKEDSIIDKIKKLFRK